MPQSDTHTFRTEIIIKGILHEVSITAYLWTKNATGVPQCFGVQVGEKIWFHVYNDKGEFHCYAEEEARTPEELVQIAGEIIYAYYG